MKNLSKITGEKQVGQIFDAEIFTNVFSKMEPEMFEKITQKLVNKNIRRKVFDKSKVLGKYNALIDATRFQKAHYEMFPEMLHETINEKTTYYQAVEEIKLVGNGMAIPMCTEMIRNTDIPKEDEDSGEEKRKQDCEINAMKRILPKLHSYYPRLELRIIGDALYACEPFIEICENYKWEYMTVLQDGSIPTVLDEYRVLVGEEKDNIIYDENEIEIKITQWVNEIDYRGHKLNVLEEITYDKKTKEQTKWIWITNRIITKGNARILVKTAKDRSYIENQGFREQKITSGLELEHVYSKNYKAMQIIYQLIQIAHMILQYIEHTDIVKEGFTKKYGNVRVYARKLYARLILEELSELELEILFNNKIQIRFVYAI